MSAPLTARDRACEIVDRLSANGAVFDHRAAAGALPATFNYTLARGGDRWRCRSLILDAKADPAIWQELVAEVGRRAVGGVA